MPSRPEIAVIGPNALVNIGLKSLLERIIPAADVAIFADFESLVAEDPGRFAHLFVAAETFVPHAPFFRAPDAGRSCRRRQHPRSMHRHAHARRAHLGGGARARHPAPARRRAPRSHLAAPAPAPLTDREREVLYARRAGLPQQADRRAAGIGLTTVITHRRNFAEKLGIRSVAELTLYAVTTGLVATEQI